MTHLVLALCGFSPSLAHGKCIGLTYDCLIIMETEYTTQDSFTVESTCVLVIGSMRIILNVSNPCLPSGLSKALYENMLVELPFAGFFLSKLLGTSADVDIHHLASLDPEVYKNLLFLKSYEEDVEELGLNFTVVNNDLGEAQVSWGSFYSVSGRCSSYL